MGNKNGRERSSMICASGRKRRREVRELHVFGIFQETRACVLFVPDAPKSEKFAEEGTRNVFYRCSRMLYIYIYAGFHSSGRVTTSTYAVFSSNYPYSLENPLRVTQKTYPTHDCVCPENTKRIFTRSVSCIRLVPFCALRIRTNLTHTHPFSHHAWYD